MMKQKINLKRAAALFAALCLTALMTVAAYGAEAKISDELVIRQIFSITNGHQPSAGSKFSYKLTFVSCDTGDYSEAERPIVDMNGKDSATLKFSYDHAGIYEYRLEQVVEKEYANYVYDDSVYTIFANVENIGDELKLGFIVLDEDGNKVENITFENAYVMEGSEENPQTGDSLNVALCASLMAMSTAVIAVTLLLKKKAE